MSAKEIEEELKGSSVETDGVTVWPSRGVFFVAGYLSDDLPDSINGFEAIDDPNYQRTQSDAE